jgi:NAD(P)-dependent dehydrogenase (short-subunit alcohol dehydrogenase family)
MTGKLAGKNTLVTGATNGIGEAIAHAMAAEGANVVVSGRSHERGEQVVNAIQAAGGHAAFIAADLAQGADAASHLVKRTQASVGTLDVLVNNAAYLVGGKATVDTTSELIDEAFAVSVKAPFLLTAAVVPAMIKQGTGAIINIGSINGIIGLNGAALYGATKASLHSLTKSWAAEFGSAGIRVNTVAPGPTLTERNEAIADHLAGLVANIPSRRLSTTAEVAAAVVFLASDDASNIHGSTLSVDGGYVII